MSHELQLNVKESKLRPVTHFTPHNAPSRHHHGLPALGGLIPSPSQPHVAQLLKITSKVPPNLPPATFPPFITPDSNYVFILHHLSFKRRIIFTLPGPSVKSSPESEVHFPFLSVPRVLGFCSHHLVMQSSYYVLKLAACFPSALPLFLKPPF